ncbi:Hsp70 family protein [Nocardia neocaledoniensis]|uniref:Hsp70 family protein n=1 Tax=Nocardia neocaledoniensis TaxID=236511 RepID=UPI002457C6E4|nr:Hsp70 family protein [Nocardia neocaledoniensis]
MVLVLGVSAGASGARAVLTHSDQPHLPPVDRIRLPRRAGGSVDEAVLAAIRRLRVAALARDECVTATAVTCRSEVHADAIRAALGRSEVGIVDEPLAQLRYLRFTGLLPASGTVILYDLGCSGLTITHADCRTDTILASRRSTVLSGDGYDALLRWQLARGGVLADARTSRAHRESLSRTRVVTATDTDTGGRAVVTRSDLAELCEAGLHHSASFVRQVIEETGVRPDALVPLGGCSRNPTLREDLAQLIGLPIVYDPEPDYVSARGAVLLAAQRPPARLRMRRLYAGATLATRDSQRPGRRKLLAAVAVTATLGGAVAGLLGTDGTTARPPETGPAPTPAPLNDGYLHYKQN